MTKTRKSPIDLLQEFSIPLISGVILAILWANLDNHSYHNFIHTAIVTLGATQITLHWLINDIFMCFFFAIAVKEITEAFLPNGALNPIKKAINPLIATIGGVLGPAIVYTLFVRYTGDYSIQKGWGIPTATDIALAWLIARLVFGKGHPAVKFLLLLAVADDGIGLAIIAIFYPNPTHPVQPAFLILVGLAIGIAYYLRISDKKKKRNFWPYLACGAISWSGLYFANLHPALALVPIIPFMSNMGHDDGLYMETSTGKKYTDALNSFEHFFKLPVDFGLFAFGIVNAGVVFSSIGNATWAVFLGLALGKTIGTTGFSVIAHYAGFSLPEGMDFKTLFVASIIASLGLTVALFVAGVAFTDPTTVGAAKMGALFSSAMALVAVVTAQLLKINKKKQMFQSVTNT